MSEEINQVLAALEPLKQTMERMLTIVELLSQRVEVLELERIYAEISEDLRQ